MLVNTVFEYSSFCIFLFYAVSSVETSEGKLYYASKLQFFRVV